MMRRSDPLEFSASLLLAAIGVGPVPTLVFRAGRGLPAILVDDLTADPIAAAVTARVFRFRRVAAWSLLPWLSWIVATTVLRIGVHAAA